MEGPNGLGWPKLPKVAKIAQGGLGWPKLVKVAQMAQGGPKWPRVAQITKSGPWWPKVAQMAKMAQGGPNCQKLPRVTTMAKSGPEWHKWPCRPCWTRLKQKEPQQHWWWVVAAALLVHQPAPELQQGLKGLALAPLQLQRISATFRPMNLINALKLKMQKNGFKHKL